MGDALMESLGKGLGDRRLDLGCVAAHGTFGCDLAGCHAVTANKGPAAFAFEELSALAYDRDASFLFEGAVMDGVHGLSAGTDCPSSGQRYGADDRRPRVRQMAGCIRLHPGRER